MNAKDDQVHVCLKATSRLRKNETLEQSDMSLKKHEDQAQSFGGRVYQALDETSNFYDSGLL